MRLTCIILRHCYNLAESTRDYALAFITLVTTHHRMRFTATCLTIGEDGSVVAVQHIIH